jgi:hypothetical protein
MMHVVFAVVFAVLLWLVAMQPPNQLPPITPTINEMNHR